MSITPRVTELGTGTLINIPKVDYFFKSKLNLEVTLKKFGVLIYKEHHIRELFRTYVEVSH